jgi:Na+-translocating ferredoxin:NAD+ oxidoreductase RnfA subunit
MKVDKPWGWYNTLTPEQTAPNASKMIVIDHRNEMLLQGIAWGIGITASFGIAFVIFANNTEPVEKFKVVDQYEGCNVVRYTDRSNQWHYLLKCP